MDVTDTLLKCLKSKRVINDVNDARKAVKTDTVNLKTDSDLYIRDAIMGLGTILKENLEEHYYITTVKMGVFGNVLAHAIVLRDEKKANLAVYAKEGFFKQNLAEKGIEKLKERLE